MKDWQKVLGSGNLLLVPTSIGKGAAGKFFLLNTSGRDSITEAAAREVTDVHDIRVRRADNSVLKPDALTIVFAGIHQEIDQEASIAVLSNLSNLSNRLGIEVSEQIGYPLLRLEALQLDYRDDLIKVTTRRTSLCPAPTALHKAGPQATPLKRRIQRYRVLCPLCCHSQREFAVAFAAACSSYHQLIS